MNLRVALYLAFILLAFAVAGAVDLAQDEHTRAERTTHVSTR
jgi:hypothetical protein